jgi:hypothetical protein
MHAVAAGFGQETFQVNERNDQPIDFQLGFVKHVLDEFTDATHRRHHFEVGGLVPKK